MDVKVKICGLRCEDDVRLAVAGGADFVGVLLDEGPRRVAPDQITALVVAAGVVPLFLVAVHMGGEEILTVARRVGASGAQLHGEQSEVDARLLRRAGLTVWRTARLGADSDMEPLRASAEADAVLVEPRVAYHHGGTGVALSLEAAGRARQALGVVPMVLAGGLRPETVANAIRSVRPYAVDVSSGVELQPGRKDPERMTQFLAAVRNA